MFPPLSSAGRCPHVWATIGSLLFGKLCPVVSQTQPVLGAQAAHLAWQLQQQGLRGVTSTLSLPAKQAHMTGQGCSTPVPATILGQGFQSP